MNALYWWIDRWRKSTAYTDMTVEEQGAYRNLLDEATLRGGALPNVERVLARASGDVTAWKRVREAVMRRFELKPDGCWHNDTLDSVLQKTVQLSETRSRAGKHGNAARWQVANRVANPIAKPIAKTSHADAIAKGIANASSPDPDQDLVTKNQDLPAAREERAPTARASDPRASSTSQQRRRVATDARAGRGASAPVDEALVKKHFG